MKLKRTICMVIGIVCLTIAQCVAAYFTNFESGVMTGLHTGGPGGGIWQIVNSTDTRILSLSGDPSAGSNSKLGAYCIFEDTQYNNFVMTGRMKSDERFTGAPNQWHDTAVVFGFVDEDNYYYASFNYFNNAGCNGIIRISGNSVTKLSEWTSSYGVLKDAGWHSFKIVKSGPVIEVYYNQQLVFTATDSSISHGRIGVGSLNDNCSFDDIYILPEGETPLNLPPHFDYIGNKKSNVKQTLAFTLKATDPNEDSLTFNGTNMPSGAQLINNNNNTATFSWQIGDNQSGAYTVNFSVSDSNNNAAQQTVSINVGTQVSSILKPELAGVHPRLFFKQSDFDELKARAKTTHLRYMNNCISEGRRYGENPPISQINVNDTEALRYAWWILPQAVMAGLFSDSQYKEPLIQKAKTYVLDFCAASEWQSGSEANIGMGAANILAGVAMAYDSLYHFFSPEERVLISNRIARQVILLYENGFLMQQKSTTYWQHDHSNNHMHHRLCGLLLGALAVCDEVEGMEYYAQAAIEEARKVAQTISPDGSSHESPTYWLFGTTYIVPAFYALMHTAGIDLFDETEFFRNAAHYRAHMLTPGQRYAFDYGDGGVGTYYFANFLFYLVSRYQDGHMQALMDKAYDAVPGSFIYNAWNFLWWDSHLERKPVNEITTYRYFDDMEIATFRSGWDESDTAILFKCGPYGGHRANEMRNGRYINVAHDKPDANSFTIYSNGEFLITHGNHSASTDRYTRDHNSLLVDGQGMVSDCQGWSQPFAGMESMGRIIDYHGSPGYGFAVGESGEYYSNLNSYKRNLVFVDNAFYAVHDIVEADKNVTLDWIFHGPPDFTSSGGNSYRINKNNASLGLHVFSPIVLTGSLSSKKEGQRTMLTLKTKNKSTRGELYGVFIPNNFAEKVLYMDSDSCYGLKITGENTNILLFAKQGFIEYADYSINAEKAVFTVQNGNVGAVMAAGCTALNKAGKTLLAFSDKTNVTLKVTDTHYNFWVNRPLRGAQNTNVDLTLGVSEPNHEFYLQQNSQLTSIYSDSGSLLRFNISVSSPAEFSINFNGVSAAIPHDEGSVVWEESDSNIDTGVYSITQQGGRLVVYNNVIKAKSSVPASIQCDMPLSGELKIVVYDSRGKEIKIIYDGIAEQGLTTYPWHGDDSKGSKVGSGVYMVHVKSGQYSQTKKIVVVK